MLRVIASIGLLLSLAGCGSNPQVPVDTPLAQARAACYWLPEHEFGEAIATLAGFAAAGFTRAEALAMWTSVDSPLATSEGWVGCGLAQIDLVYGR